MILQRACPKCASQLAHDLSDGLCPACLLQVGLFEETGSTAGDDADIALDSHANGSPVQKRINRASKVRVGEQFGRYRIIRLLGKGGMGEVYEADDLEARRRVAIKVLGNAQASPADHDRFLLEGRLAAAINHPNTTYIYGTEDIDGIRVICMELVPGGTLKDLLEQKGPLPVIEAVDAILQVIAGLVAIQAHGIVHRDIKPANCLLDGSGIIKVGDFGLSTAASGDENPLKGMDYFRGTPAFSSPEQLRGENLDVRSDIYSVGVTLFWLLTGKTPFEARNIGDLIETVCKTLPHSPRRLRPEIPKGLSQIILRCLEKEPKNRYKTYAELQRALQPFASPAPDPATLLRRGLAAAVDNVILVTASIILASHSFQLALFASSLVYYSLLEGLFRRTAGGALFGLQVVGPNGATTGIPRAVLRTFCFIIILSVPAQNLPTFIAWRLVWLLIIFSTATSKNGLSGLHDLISNTRVLFKPVYKSPRPATQGSQTRKPAAAEKLQDETRAAIGPYSIVKLLKKYDGIELLQGHDPKLQREVWIEVLPAGSPELPAARRGVCRVGRLRWVNSVRSSAQSWDAYEALSGTSLLRLIPDKQAWDKVRYWLLDLAEELSAGLADQSLPPLVGLERVWIGKDGRAKLLDFPAPDISGENSLKIAIAVKDSRSARLFLNQVAVALLEGSPVSAADAQREVAVPIPLHARQFLNELRVPDPLVIQLKSLPDKPAHISRTTRAGIIASLALIPILVAIPWTGLTILMQQECQKQPDLAPLRRTLDRLESVSWNPNETAAKRALEIYVAQRYSGTVSDSNIWSTAYAQFFMSSKRRLAEEAVATFRNASPEDVEASTRLLDPYIKEYNPEVIPGIGTTALTIFIKSFCLFAGVASVFCPLLLRQSPLLRLWGVAFVSTDGSVVSWLRVACRNFLAWLPMFMIAILDLYNAHWLGSELLLLILLCIFLAGVAWSAFATRSIQDRISGTNLVPY